MAGRLFPNRNLPIEGEIDLRAPISAFGRYDLLDKIGEGTTSEVFVARSDGFEGLFRLNALKRLKPALCSDVATVSRFIEEARLAVRVEHPGTVAVDDFGRVGGVYFIAFEMIDGVTLEELITKVRARGLALDPRAAAHIVRACAHAIDHVHRQKRADGKPLGLVHADLQKRNVLIARDGRVKVRNFAAPSVFASTDAREGALGPVGLASQAPEVLDGALPTAASDVWSLGVLLWELLVGERLFAGDSVKDVCASVLRAPLRAAPTTIAIPGAVKSTLDAALQRDPAQRSTDARALALELADYLTGADYDDAAFVHTLLDLDGDDARGAPLGRQPTRVERVPRTNPLGAGAASTADTKRVVRPAPVDLPPASAVLAQQLEKDPGTWGLVRLAEKQAHDKVDDARAMFRSAAVLFASRGQLAQALCAYDGARKLLTPEDIAVDLRKLAELGGADYSARQAELRRVGGLVFYEALRAQTDGGVDRGNLVPTPFLSPMGPDAFARLAQLSRVRRYQAGQHILREGEPGDSLFALGEGRLVVTCTPSQIDPVDADPEPDSFEEHTDPGIGGVRRSGVVVRPGLESELERLEDGEHERQDRVFLSALTAGDIFGEFSFLTGRPRSASVEAVTSCRVVEITRRAVGDLFEKNLSLKDALEAFYKERVLEWMLAKNEVFSLLEPERRRQLLAQCGVYDIPKGKMVVREGELHDAMYFIKRGEVEVFLDDKGTQVFINKLGAGEFFGEIAALEGGPRRASVRAVTDLEVFRITRDDLAQVLEDADDVRERLERAMRQRSAELRRRIAEQRKILGST